MSTYDWRDGMDEISGMGGSYEEGCRVMVKAGCEYLDAHPGADPQFHGFAGIYGVIAADNDDATALSGAMIAAADAAFPDGGVTGAMHQAAVTAVLFIRANGWETYVAHMSEPAERAD